MQDVFIEKALVLRRFLEKNLVDKNGGGNSVDLQACFFNFTFDSIMRIFFGEDVNTAEGERNLGSEENIFPYFGIQKWILNELRPVPRKQNKNNTALGKMPSQQASNLPTLHSLQGATTVCATVWYCLYICLHSSFLGYNMTFIFVVIWYIFVCRNFCFECTYMYMIYFFNIIIYNNFMISCDWIPHHWGDDQTPGTSMARPLMTRRWLLGDMPSIPSVSSSFAVLWQSTRLTRLTRPLLHPLPFTIFYPNLWLSPWLLFEASRYVSAVAFRWKTRWLGLAHLGLLASPISTSQGLHQGIGHWV